MDTIFGVPGDFNLQFLDSIFHVQGLRWVGNQNELNAAYASDGYARIKGVPGVFVTTHGVGELSALNGVAGAMSERVKMIHVVGQTTRAMQNNHMMIHHSIGDKPDHQVCVSTVRMIVLDILISIAAIQQCIERSSLRSSRALGHQDCTFGD